MARVDGVRLVSCGRRVKGMMPLGTESVASFYLTPVSLGRVASYHGANLH
jgi:hypothetical protein